MITSSDALDATNLTTGSLDYINTIVSGLTLQGTYSAFIDGKFMNDDMATVLRTDYGYKITKSFTDMGTYPTYKLDWSSDTPII